MLVLTTRWPGRTAVTPGPAATTTPANSWPMIVPSSKPGVWPRRGQRAAPQIAVARSWTIAAVGSLSARSPASSTLIAPGPARTTAFIPGAPSVVRHPSVDDEQLSGHPACLLGGKEGDRGRDVGRLASPRDALQHLDELERLLVRTGQHALRGRQAGRDSVDGEPVLAELTRQRPGERVDTSVRGDDVS